MLSKNHSGGNLKLIILFFPAYSETLAFNHSKTRNAFFPQQKK